MLVCIPNARTNANTSVIACVIARKNDRSMCTNYESFSAAYGVAKRHFNKDLPLILRCYDINLELN